MKLTKYDIIVSQIVRLRANFTCEALSVFHFPDCRRLDPDGQASYKSRIIQCSHFRGRGTGFVARHDTDNCRSLCAYCHSYVESRPDDHAYLLRTILGETRYNLMRERCNKAYKITKVEKADMYKHYQGEGQRLIKARRSGDMGYIELVNWF